MTSLGTEYYQIFLSQGVLLGLSMALILNPTLAVVSSRVPHKRGMAFGLAIGGSSIGGIVWPIMLQELLYKREVGFGWTMRAAGFVMMLPLGIACFTIRNPPAQCTTSNKPPSQSCPKASEAPDEAEDKAEREKKVDFSILKKPAFLLLCLGLSCAYLGLLTPLFYLSSYAVTQGTAPATAFYLLAGLNAASFFGRVVPGILADRYGHFNLCATAALTSGIVAFCWTHATSSGGLIVLSLAYGFVSGVRTPFPSGFLLKVLLNISVSGSYEPTECLRCQAGVRNQLWRRSWLRHGNSVSNVGGFSNDPFHITSTDN